MATSFKAILNEDIQTTATKLHESIPVTGTILSGTYSDQNVKNYAHGMFQSVYDYPYLSSSANHILDITMGYSANSVFSSSANTQNSQKIQMYNQMAQVLVGHDPTGSIREFDEDGNLTAGPKMRECLFLNFARLLSKDEIKKGSFSLTLGVNPSGTAGTAAIPAGAFIDRNVVITDASGSNGYKTNSPAGEYGILFVTSSQMGARGTLADTTMPLTFGAGIPCGLVYYQAGIVVLTSSLFIAAESGGLLRNSVVGGVGMNWINDTTQNNAGKVIFLSSSNYGMRDMFMSASISGTADGLRNRIQTVSFNNTTEMNSTIYFCRANANDFNYSSNPTYVTASKIRVKETRSDQPISYMTTVGLYSLDNELLAVAKLSEPLKKTPANEYTLRVRLDY